MILMLTLKFFAWAYGYELQSPEVLTLFSVGETLVELTFGVGLIGAIKGWWR